MKEERIYKYELKITDGQNISLPIGAKILTVQTQGEKVCLWALVDPKASTEFRFFEIFGTGHAVACFWLPIIAATFILFFALDQMFVNY